MEWTGGHGRDGAQHDRDETREKPPHKQAGTRVSCVPRGVRRFEVDWCVGVGTVWCEQRRAAAKGKRHVLAPLALRLRRRDGLGIPISVRRTTRGDLRKFISYWDIYALLVGCGPVAGSPVRAALEGVASPSRRRSSAPPSSRLGPRGLGRSVSPLSRTRRSLSRRKAPRNRIKLRLVQAG